MQQLGETAKRPLSQSQNFLQQRSLSNWRSARSQSSMSNNSQSTSSRQIRINITGLKDSELDSILNQPYQDPQEKIYVLSKLLASLRNKVSKLQVQYLSDKSRLEAEIKELQNENAKLKGQRE